MPAGNEYHTLRFTAIVVTWNSAAEVPALIDSVRDHLDGSCELLFVDNASSDEITEVVRARAPDSRVLALPENLGFGRANNIGVGAATTDVVVLLNPDTVIVDDSLARLAELAAGERALFAPRLLNEDGTRQISAFPPLASWQSGLISILPGPILPRKVRVHCEPWRYDERLRVGWLSGACLVADRKLMLELGPFDQRLVLYGEDSDLGLRAERLGIPSIFAPDVSRIKHLGSRSGGQVFDDLGTRRKLEARRWIVRNRLGRVRGWYDFSTQFALHGLRFLAKAAMRRETRIERLWLRAALRAARSRPVPPEQLADLGANRASRSEVIR